MPRAEGNSRRKPQSRFDKLRELEEENKGKMAGCSWVLIGSIAWDHVSALIDSGLYIGLSKTSDGGKLVFTMLDGNDKYKDYLSPFEVEEKLRGYCEKLQIDVPKSTD